MRQRTTSLFLLTVWCSLSAAQEPIVPQTQIKKAPDISNEPTRFTIVLPSLNPVESVDNSLGETELDNNNKEGPEYEDVFEYTDDLENLNDDDDEDVDGEIMKRARNIVFRPLFTYRQKKIAKRRVQVRRNAARKSSSRRNAQKRNAQPANKYYSYNRNSYYRPRYPSYYPSYYYNAQFPTIA